MISNRGNFYRVLLFNADDIILRDLFNDEILSIKNLFSLPLPPSDEIYELFLFNFRPAVYQVGG